jgi:hypothetical protein
LVTHTRATRSGRGPEPDSYASSSTLRGSLNNTAAGEVGRASRVGEGQ